MAKHVFDMNTAGVDQFAEVLENYDGEAGRIINDVLWNEAGSLIADSIIHLLPRSNRKPWKGKPKAASSVMPFTQKNDPLSVTVKSKNAYHYLYFPDDGTNTRNHVGNQQFMIRGAEAKQDEIIERCITRLTQL